MIKLNPESVRTDDLVFVLLGEQFEEVTAAIFITTLRQFGLCVKAIGLAGQRPSGKNGLAFYPDITLRMAVNQANNAACIILPCSVSAIKLAETDPRIADFFQITCSTGAQFVVSNIDSIQKTSLNKLSISKQQISTYRSHHNLPSFANDLAKKLSKQTG